METLKIALSTLYAASTVRAILNGTRRPNLENVVKLRDNFGIPIDVWLDVKSYVSHSQSMPDTDVHHQEETENQLHRKESA